jgi:hypothetical protein
VGDHVAAQHLGEHAQRKRLVCDGEEDAEREDEHEANEDADDVSPYGQLCRRDLIPNDAEDKSDNAEDAVPEAWDLFVRSHQACVHVLLLAQGRTELAHDIVAVPDYSVGGQWCTHNKP